MLRDPFSARSAHHSPERGLNGRMLARRSAGRLRHSRLRFEVQHLPLEVMYTGPALLNGTNLIEVDLPPGAAAARRGLTSHLTHWRAALVECRLCAP